MTTRSALQGNPFAVLLNPSAILAACQKSKHLAALRSAVHRPLDRPHVFLDTSAAEYDAAIDAGLPVSPVPARKTGAPCSAGASVYEPEVLVGAGLILEGSLR